MVKKVKKKNNFVPIIFVGIGLIIIIFLVAGIVNTYNPTDDTNVEVKNTESMYSVEQLSKTSFIDSNRFGKINDNVYVDRYYQQTISLEEVQKRIYLSTVFLRNYKGDITYKTELDYLDFMEQNN